MDRQPQERKLNVRPIRDDAQKVTENLPNRQEELMEAIRVFKRKSRTAIHIPKPKKPRRKRRIFSKADEKSEKISIFSSMQGQIAICAALVIAAMAIKSIDLPAAQTTSAVIKDAVTMEMDIDEPLGGLEFVQNMFPETVAVLWQQTATDELQAPVNGKVTGRYSMTSPGLTIEASEPKVYACWNGKIKNVEKSDTGDTVITVSHQGGLETVYARLASANVSMGDEVKKGQLIGDCSKNENTGEMFLQVRLSGVVVDPEPYFK